MTQLLGRATHARVVVQSHAHTHNRGKRRTLGRTGAHRSRPIRSLDHAHAQLVLRVQPRKRHLHRLVHVGLAHHPRHVSRVVRRGRRRSVVRRVERAHLVRHGVQVHVPHNRLTAKLVPRPQRRPVRSQRAPAAKHLAHARVRARIQLVGDYLVRQPVDDVVMRAALVGHALHKATLLARRHLHGMHLAVGHVVAHVEHRLVHGRKHVRPKRLLGHQAVRRARRHQHARARRRIVVIVPAHKPIPRHVGRARHQRRRASLRIHAHQRAHVGELTQAHLAQQPSRQLIVYVRVHAHGRGPVHRPQFHGALHHRVRPRQLDAARIVAPQDVVATRSARRQLGPAHQHVQPRRTGVRVRRIYGVHVKGRLRRLAQRIAQVARHHLGHSRIRVVHHGHGLVVGHKRIAIRRADSIVQHVIRVRHGRAAHRVDGLHVPVRPLHRPRGHLVQVGRPSCKRCIDVGRHRKRDVARFGIMGRILQHGRGVCGYVHRAAGRHAGARNVGGGIKAVRCVHRIDIHGMVHTVVGTQQIRACVGHARRHISGRPQTLRLEGAGHLVGRQVLGAYPAHKRVRRRAIRIERALGRKDVGRYGSQANGNFALGNIDRLDVVVGAHLSQRFPCTIKQRGLVFTCRCCRIGPPTRVNIRIV